MPLGAMGLISSESTICVANICAKNGCHQGLSQLPLLAIGIKLNLFESVS